MGNSTKPQACNNCKKRKLKCDYRSPGCLRCERAQITCKGYQRETVFIVKTAAKQRLVPKNNNLRSTPPPTYEDCLQELRSQLKRPTANRPRLRADSLAILKKLYLPLLSPAEFERSPVFTWLPIVCRLQGSSHALDHSLYTFCVIQVAITKRGSVSVEEALQTYYDSLKMLREELEDESVAKKDELLGAISVISICELYVCHTGNAWQAHAQGISDILRIRGDLDISTPVQRSLYFRIGLILLFESLSKRLSAPTSSFQFRKLLPMAHNRDPLSELLYVAWEVPTVLEDSNRLMASTSNAILGELPRECIFNPSLYMIAKLQDHQQRYRGNLETPPYWAMPSTAHFPADQSYQGKLFPFALQFQSVEASVHMVLYWAIVLQVHCNIITLHEHFAKLAPTTNFQNPTQPLLPNSDVASLITIREEAEKLARYLCQSIEYCYKSANGTVGPQLTCYAQWILKQYFRQQGHERELAWCEDIKSIRGAGFHSGLELMCFGE